MKKSIKYLELFDDVIQVILAVSLLIAAAIILGITLYNFAQNLTDNYFRAIIELIHELLLIMILLELFSTVITYLKEHIIPLAPFIIIGIISSLRKLLTIGAEMTLSGITQTISDKIFQRYLTELGVHTAIVFVLVIALWFVKKYRAATVEPIVNLKKRTFNKSYNKYQQKK